MSDDGDMCVVCLPYVSYNRELFVTAVLSNGKKSSKPD